MTAKKNPGVRPTRTNPRQRASQNATARLLNVLLNLTTNAIISVDQNQRIVLFNTGAEELFGYDATEIIGQPLDVLLPERFVEAHRQHIQDFAATSETTQRMDQRRVVAGRRKDGTEFPVRASITKLTTHGTAGFTVIMLDMRERQRLEEEHNQQTVLYESLLAAQSDLGEGVALVDAQGRFLYVNDALCTLYESTREELLALPSFWGLVAPELVPALREQFARRLRGDQIPDPIHVTVVRKSGHRIEIEVAVKRLGIGQQPHFFAIIRDITERKRAEAVLQQYQAIVNATSDAIVSFTVAGMVTTWNPGAEQMFGYTAEEMLGRPIQTLVPAGQREHFWRIIEASAPDQHVVRLPGQQLRKDGTRVDVSVSVSPIYNETGVIIGRAAVIRDITARIRVEAALRASEARYRNLVDSAQDIVFSLAPDGTITSLNPAFERMLGWSRDEWLGKPFAPLLHPDDLTRVLGLFQQVLQGITPVIGEKRLRTKGGTYVTVEATATASFEDGRALSVLGIARDITERKRAQKEMELHSQITASMAEGVCLVRARDGIIVYANQTCEQMFGYGAGELINEPISIFKAPGEQSPEESARAIMAALNQYSAWQGEVRTRKKDGTPFWCYAIISTFHHPEHGAVWVAIHQDITERKRTEDALREANAQLEAFTYTVSHDLRAPLRAQEGFARALLEDYGDRLDELGRDYAGRIIAAGQRMDAMIRDLLAYSRLSHAELVKRVVSLDPVLDDALAQLEAAIREVGAHIVVERPLPAVLGDLRTLVQVVTNLLSNGMKFVAAGQVPQIRVRADREQGAVRLWVEDNGIGIAPEHQERIFRVFERLHGIESYPGTGIGLAIVRKGVERMDGLAGVVSAPGQGSQFWIALPEG